LKPLTSAATVRREARLDRMVGAALVMFRAQA